MFLTGLFKSVCSTSIEAARRIIRVNFADTLAVDAVGVGLAAAGLLNPLLAAFIHVTSELAFILNSARLLPGGTSSGLRATAATSDVGPSAPQQFAAADD